MGRAFYIEVGKFHVYFENIARIARIEVVIQRRFQMAEILGEPIYARVKFSCNQKKSFIA